MTRIGAFLHGRHSHPARTVVTVGPQRARSREFAAMPREELIRLTGNGNGNCNNDDCPNVYRTEHGSLIVQGDVSQAFAPRPGEGLVEIPESVLKEAVRALGW